MTKVFLVLFRRRWLGIILLSLLIGAAIPGCLNLRVNVDYFLLLLKKKDPSYSGTKISDLIFSTKTDKHDDQPHLDIKAVSSDLGKAESKSTGLGRLPDGVSGGTHKKVTLVFKFGAKSPSILNADYLQALKRCQQAVQKLLKHGKVYTLFDAKILEFNDFKMSSPVSEQRLFYNGNYTKRALHKTRQQIVDDYPLLRRYISKDLRFSTMYVTYAADNLHMAYKVFNHIEDLTAGYAQFFSRIDYVHPLLSRKHDWSFVSTELPLLSATVLILLCIMTAGMLKRWSFAVITVVLNCLNLLVVGGVMGAMGWVVNLLCLIIPVLIIAVGSTELIHLLSAYDDGLKKYSGQPTRAAVFMIKKVGMACVATGGTTALGLFSFAISHSYAIREFGLASGSAMLITALVNLFVLPLLLAYLPRKQRIAMATSKNFWIDRLRMSVAQSLSCRFWPALMLGVVVSVSLLYAVRVTYDINTFQTLKGNHPYSKRIADFVQRHGGLGVMTVEIKLPAGEKFLQPDTFRKVRAMSHQLESEPTIDSIDDYSLVVAAILHKLNSSSVIQLVHGDRLSENEPEIFVQFEKGMTPRQRDEIGLSADYNRMKMLVRYRVGTLKTSRDLKQSLLQTVHHYLGNTVSVKVNYAMEKKYTVLDYFFFDSLYAIVGFSVFLLVLFSILWRSVRVGMAMMLPIILVSLLMVAFMGGVHIPLNSITISAFIVVLSVGIDFAIHLYTDFYQHNEYDTDGAQMANNVLFFQLKPLFISMVGVVLPMFVMTVASNVSFVQICMMIGFGILCSFVCNFVCAGVFFRWCARPMFNR